MVMGLGCTVHEIPVSLWLGVEGIFSVFPDWSQVTLYQQNNLRFFTAVSKVCPAYVYGGGEIDFMVMLCRFRGNHCNMLCNQFAEVIEDQSGVCFLIDQIFFPAVEIYETNGIF